MKLRDFTPIEPSHLPVSTAVRAGVWFSCYLPPPPQPLSSAVIPPVWRPPRGDRRFRVMSGGRDADRSWWRELCRCLFTWSGGLSQEGDLSIIFTRNTSSSGFSCSRFHVSCLCSSLAAIDQERGYRSRWLTASYSIYIAFEDSWSNL